MAKKWYPVVDYSSCTECGVCSNFCPHNVYDKTKSPVPVVVRPDDCVDHCHGCGSRCPVGAITYVGDDTGWTPPNKKAKDEEPSCACGMSTLKPVVVEYLYLDLSTCDRCKGTDSVLDDVLMTMMPTLKMAGYNVILRKTEISDALLAKKHRFYSSPTIRVNGHDIFGIVKENKCDCCAGISGMDVDCRTYEYEGTSYDVPTKKMVSEAILKIVLTMEPMSVSSDEYAMPENLKKFFEGKTKKQKCSCDGKCC
jgi:NAD-dependent dihydropyrimidine dehydrogenase PreA subunit